MQFPPFIWQSLVHDKVSFTCLRTEAWWKWPPFADETFKCIIFNSLAPGKFEWNFRYLILQIISVTNGWGISCELALRSLLPYGLTRPQWVNVIFYFDKHFTEICSSGLNLFLTIGSRDGLLQKRQVSITWTNDDHCIFQPYGPQSHIELFALYNNSLRLSDAYLLQSSMSSLVQMMVCCLFGTKPLSEPMLAYCQ